MFVSLLTDVERSVTLVVLKNISLSSILGFIMQRERERERERERGRERERESARERYSCHVEYMSNVDKISHIISSCQFLLVNKLMILKMNKIKYKIEPTKQNK